MRGALRNALPAFAGRNLSRAGAVSHSSWARSVITTVAIDPRTDSPLWSVQAAHPGALAGGILPLGKLAPGCFIAGCGGVLSTVREPRAEFSWCISSRSCSSGRALQTAPAPPRPRDRGGLHLHHGRLAQIPEARATGLPTPYVMAGGDKTRGIRGAYPRPWECYTIPITTASSY